MQIAGDAGADVIKVESVQRIDGWRGTTPLPGVERPWERSPNFNWVNRSKRGITLNLTDPRGSEIIKRLVEQADILIENYTPRVMGNFGLEYETLRAINPRLIMMSMPGFGADVSWRDYVAFGMSTEQMSGISHLTGYADGPPIFTGMNGGDPFVGGDRLDGVAGGGSPPRTDGRGPAHRPEPGGVVHAVRRGRGDGVDAGRA